jgi:hypothetical protein
LLEPTPDLVQLNAALLSNPAGIANHPLVRTLAEQDTELGFLCPLARALVRLDRGDCDAATAEAALATCWLVDDSAINRPEDWEPGDNLEAIETVEHHINTDFEGAIVLLTFRSKADLLYCSENYKDHITAATAADLLAQKGDLSLINTPDALAEWLMEHAGNPVGQPEGEDEPLCSIRYQLVGIGHVEIAGPVFENGYHESSLENLNEEYQQRPDDEVFCWLHALDDSHAEQLGVASSEAITDSDEGGTPLYPAWVSPGADVEACWITADQLQESYAQGRRLRQGGNEIRLELGCGLDWDPRHDSEQFPDEDPEDGSLSYPDGHQPIVQLSIGPDSEHDSKQLKDLLQVLNILASMSKAS